DLPQEDDLALPLGDGNGEVPNPLSVRRKRGQLVIVRREERPRPLRRVVQVLRDRPRDRDAVERARAAPDLVQDDEASRTELGERVRRLLDLEHERWLA